MDMSKISSILGKLSMRAVETVSSIKAETFETAYGIIADLVHNFSTKVGIIEGIVVDPDAPPLTDTDLAFARALKDPVRGGNWEGWGQQIQKMFSIITGIDLNSRQVGLEADLQLTTGTIVKDNHNSRIGIISEQGNQFYIAGTDLVKNTDFRSHTGNLSVPTRDETLLFLGTIFSSTDLTRKLSSNLKVNGTEELETLILVSLNGIETDTTCNMEYRKYITGHISPAMVVAPLEDVA